MVLAGNIQARRRIGSVRPNMSLESEEQLDLMSLRCTHFRRSNRWRGWRLEQTRSSRYLESMGEGGGRSKIRSLGLNTHRSYQHDLEVARMCRYTGSIVCTWIFLSVLHIG